VSVSHIAGMPSVGQCNGRGERYDPGTVAGEIDVY
jgi:hypothetical protein